MADIHSADAGFWDAFLKRDLSFLSEHSDASLFSDLFATCRGYANHIKGRVLEIGCGDGMDAIAMALQYGVEVVGIDMSAARIALADANRRRFGGRAAVATLLADAHALPFEAESFDTVLGNSVMLFLEHDRALKEIARILKPGGHLILANESLAPSPLARLSRAVRLGFRSGELERHISERVSPAEIDELGHRYFSGVNYDVHMGAALQLVWGIRLVFERIKSAIVPVDRYRKPDVRCPRWLRRLDSTLIDRWRFYRNRTWIVAACLTK